MLNQNIKGFLTLLLILSLFAALYFGYKGIFEPRFVNDTVGEFPVDVGEATVTPEIEIQSNLAIIKWETPYESIGSVLYTTNKETCMGLSTGECGIANSASGLSHEVTLENLEPGQEYFYKISIDSTKYPIEEGEFFSFITPQASQASSTGEVSPILEEFKNAMQNQDLSYDFNGDNTITILDLAGFKKSIEGTE